MKKILTLLAAFILIAFALAQGGRFDFNFATPGPYSAANNDVITVDVTPWEDGQFHARMDAWDSNGIVVLSGWASGGWFPPQTPLTFRVGYTRSWEPCEGDLTGHIQVYRYNRGQLRPSSRPSQEFVVLDDGC